jgi:hypothetical protein
MNRIRLFSSALLIIILLAGCRDSVATNNPKTEDAETGKWASVHQVLDAMADKDIHRLKAILDVQIGADRHVPIILAKYKDSPEDVRKSWDLVSDTANFWMDIAILYEAAMNNNREAIRVLLIIGLFTDGAVSESMPELRTFFTLYPTETLRIIESDPRLQIRYSKADGWR